MRGKREIEEMKKVWSSGLEGSLFSPPNRFLCMREKVEHGPKKRESESAQEWKGQSRPIIGVMWKDVLLYGRICIRVLYELEKTGEWKREGNTTAIQARVG
jgi:hypothetical protein